jgi:ATP-binding cassette subfamily C protein CydD
MNLDSRLFRRLDTVRVPFALTIASGLGAGLLLIVQAYVLAQTVDRVFLKNHTLCEVQPLLLGLLVITVLRAIALWIGEAAAHTVAGHIKADLREQLVQHIMSLGPAYTRGERSGELANTVVTGIEELDAYFSQYLPQLFHSVLIPVVMLVIVFPLDLLSGVVLLLTAPLIPFFMVLIGKAANAQSRRQWTQLSRMSAHFLDVLQGLTTLKLFGRSRDQVGIIRQISEQFRDTTMSVLRIAFLSALVLEMLATLSTAIIAVEIGLRLLYSRMAFDEAFFILILAPEFYLPLRMLGTRFHAGMSGASAARRIFEVLETLPPECGPAIVGAGWKTRPGHQPAIRFDDVHYAYGDRPALSGISFTIQPGHKTALVGPSGAGKSTVVQLLLRFIAPAAGEIRIGDSDLCDLHPDAWRRQIAWVPQLPYLFAASVADNIRLARPDAPLEDVIRAAQQARADDFVRAFPDGYDTRIGERGARLSGGQAQRIALARAFLKNAPLLILDEPTSNLDLETEALLQDAMSALMQDRTTLIIAHRLGTVMDADQIVVLDAGCAVQIGTHAELITREGPYRRLIEAHGGPKGDA